MIFYHGTNAESALRLLQGARLDGVTAATEKIDGPPGFFLATEVGDSEFFALRRTLGVVLRYEISDDALVRLKSLGAVVGPIPRGRASPYFQGDELHVPVEAFEAFNALRVDAEIVISAL